MHHGEAILKLLHEDDPETIRMVQAQLVQGGMAALPDLRGLRERAAPPASLRLADVIRRIERGNVDEMFGLTCACFGEHGDLEGAAWWLAATFLPEEDFDPAQQLLEEWAAEVKRRLKVAQTREDHIETLVEYLGHEVKLRGNEEDYYSLSNSLLPEVIETRRGNPITLSLIYMLVGQRVRLPIRGVGLPGHFIIRCGDFFFDPFHGGRRLNLEDCRILLDRQGVALTPSLVQPVSPRAMLTRMLANIHLLSTESDPPLASKISGWMEALQTGRVG